MDTELDISSHFHFQIARLEKKDEKNLKLDRK